MENATNTIARFWKLPTHYAVSVEMRREFASKNKGETWTAYIFSHGPSGRAWLFDKMELSGSIVVYLGINTWQCR